MGWKPEGDLQALSWAGTEFVASGGLRASAPRFQHRPSSRFSRLVVRADAVRTLCKCVLCLVDVLMVCSYQMLNMRHVSAGLLLGAWSEQDCR